MKIIMLAMMLAVLLSGAHSSKRKGYIGRGEVSPALPPKAIESPGGTVSTPGGSNLYIMEREVVRGKHREKVSLFGKPGDTLPEQTKHYNRLNDLDTKQKCVLFIISPMFYTFQAPCFLP